VAALQISLSVSLLDSEQVHPFPGWCFSWNSWVPSGEWRDSTSIRSQPLPQEAFRFNIHQTSCHSTHNAL